MTHFNSDSQKQTIGHLLAHVSRLVGMRMRLKLHEFGLSHTQGMVLADLWHKDGVAQATLAHALNITPATTTSTLQRMEKNGWVQRRRLAADQRVIQVFLTEKARSLGREIRKTFKELDLELTSVLSRAEQDNLVSSLLKVQHHLSGQTREQDANGPKGSEDTRQGDR